MPDQPAAVAAEESSRPRNLPGDIAVFYVMSHDSNSSQGMRSETPKPMAANWTGRWEEFAQAHQPMLVAYCKRITGNAWDGDDLAQETIARVFPRVADATHIADEGAYLRRAATNLWRDELRRRGRSAPAEAPRLEETPASSDQVHDALTRVMQSLSPSQRVLVLLADVLGFTLADVGRFLSISPGAAKVAVHRARKRLREHRFDPLATVDPALVEAIGAALSSGDARKLGELLLDRAPDGGEAAGGLRYEPADERVLQRLVERLGRGHFFDRRPHDLVWVSGNIRALPEGVRLLTQRPRKGDNNDRDENYHLLDRPPRDPRA